MKEKKNKGLFCFADRLRIFFTGADHFDRFYNATV
jgi:hypothetical protein